MEKLIGYLVLGLLLAGVAYYVYRSYAKMTRKGVAKHFNLADGEQVTQMWIGELDVDISTAEKLTAAAAGLVAGALLGGIGFASARPLGVTALLTSRGRLVLVCERPDQTVSNVAFASPTEVSLRHLGEGGRRIQGGHSARFEIAGGDGVPLRVLLHESAVQYLAAWQARA